VQARLFVAPAAAAHAAPPLAVGVVMANSPVCLPAPQVLGQAPHEYAPTQAQPAALAALTVQARLFVAPACAAHAAPQLAAGVVMANIPVCVPAPQVLEHASHLYAPTQAQPAALAA